MPEYLTLDNFSKAKNDKKKSPQKQCQDMPGGGSLGSEACKCGGAGFCLGLVWIWVWFGFGVGFVWVVGELERVRK